VCVCVYTYTYIYMYIFLGQTWKFRYPNTDVYAIRDTSI